jgi:hypothetical protein
MQYLGPEYDPAAMVYRLKFIREGHVMFVDVDARTGQVLGDPLIFPFLDRSGSRDHLAFLNT